MSQSNAGGINLEGTFTTAGLGNFSSPEGRIVINGRLDNTGATLLLNAAHGYLTVQGGTIVGGTIKTQDGLALVTNGGTAPRMATLDGVTIDGQLDVVIGRTEIHTGLTLANNAQVVINGGTANTITVLAFVGDLTLGGTGTVRIESAYVAGDTIRAENGTLTVGPGITIRNVPGASGIVGGTSGSLLNQGTISSEASGRTVQVLGGAVTNDGTMRATSGGTLTVNAAVGTPGFTNRGLLLADTGSTVTVVNALTQTGTTAETRVIGSMSAASVALQGGLLTGTGTLTAPVTNTGGTVAPGLAASTGVLTVGNYTQASGGAAEFRIGGTTRGGSYDALSAGVVQFNGAIRVRLVNGYTPALGDSFDLLDRTGAFSGTPTFDFSAAALGAGLMWDTSAFPTTGVIQVIPVPEPATALVPAVLAAWVLRRRSVKAWK
jgi:hypothetical protein